jgi:hypothetical protein
MAEEGASVADDWSDDSFMVQALIPKISTSRKYTFVMFFVCTQSKAFFTNADRSDYLFGQTAPIFT